MARSKNVEERQIAIYKIRDTFSILDDKKQAWEDLHRLIQDKEIRVRRLAANTLGTIYSNIPDEHKQQAWEDLISLIHDKDINVQKGASDALGIAYSHIPEKLKHQGWYDIHQLTQDRDEDVRKSSLQMSLA